MKKILIGISVLIGITIFLYGALAAMVAQGLDIYRAVAVFWVVILGGGWMVWALRGEATGSPEDKDEP